MSTRFFRVSILASLLAVSLQLSAADKPRARTLGIPFDGTPGPLNAITDVAGVEVGYTTLISGDGPLVVGKGPVRTGVTAILPRGHTSLDDAVYAGYFSLNGNGELTGTAWIEESGFLEGPVILTNTHSVGVARDAVIAWYLAHGKPDTEGLSWRWKIGGALPVVGETWDGWLNDVNGFHVKPEHVFHALDSAKSGPIAEGSVGGGTGMVCYEFKGGTGTASRVIDKKNGGYTVGVLIQANFGLRPQLTIAGIPVGREIPENEFLSHDAGSALVVVATDAPLLPNQLKRLARRVSLGLARTGHISGDSSGDLFIAFSTANPGAEYPKTAVNSVQTLSNEKLDPLFEATVEAVEEAVINALVANQSMTGRDNHKVEALPHDRVRELLKKHGRLLPTGG